MIAQRSGADAFLEQLVAADVEWIFGNPGTTEQQLLHRLPNYPEIGFITALHESVAVVAAEGYARASGKIGVVELHAGPGLGNGMGMLFNAAEGGTPLLVYVGQSAQSGMYLEPTLSTDLVAMSAPVAKWAVEIRTVNEIPQILRRAIKVAMTEPCGPVVVTVPMDLMSAACDAAVVPMSMVDMRVEPNPASVAAAADAIAAASNPVIIVGDGVARAGAIDLVAELAHTIGAPIYGGAMAHTCIDPDEPLGAGRLPSIDAADARVALAPFDTVIAIGTSVFANVFTVPGLPLVEQNVVHIGLDPWELAKNQPSTVVFGDEARSVECLIARLKPAMEGRRDEVQARITAYVTSAAAKLDAARKRDQARFDQLPMTVERAMSEVATVLPTSTIVVDESLTGYSALGRYLRLERDGWFRLRGGGIGAGMPMPIGIQLARPGERVVAFVGDGSSMYTISAMWTAAHYDLPIVWVVLNNASYRVLKENVRRDGVNRDEADLLTGADLVNPRLDFVALAAGLGVTGRRIEDPDSLAQALTDALDAGVPYLIEVVIDGQLSD
ncbi:MAG TPA: thiamine pyrophosphate-binding protein [Pseudolysinimonas sp.]|jgi:benzoylformate decarboxylase